MNFPIIDPESNPTAQEIITAVFAYADTQPEQCMRQFPSATRPGELHTNCGYRSADWENACWVGACIPNDHPALEKEYSFSELIVQHPLYGEHPLPAWMYEHIELMRDLQNIHDEYIDTFRKPMLTHLKEKHGISWTPSPTSWLANR